MVHGTLEVLLVGAKGLENTDYLCNMDPYALLKCRSQEQRSSIASGKGSNPEWNESFVFTVSDHATELVIKLMDSDSGTSDDFVGEATILASAVSPKTSVAGNNRIEQIRKNKDSRQALRLESPSHANTIRNSVNFSSNQKTQSLWIFICSF
ncbi:elicitor-responsive protein 3-like isoform X1 [Triticum dicoccoides]|uniref:elicitor-responsive protein 3-like isoform X1 n=1 Tax=Triticum dicoccoides TaxID=85692 RepID=UPI001891BBF8|nr:elicitor-responsive protein 3-like isoform X1 [Triticum dicoccoides]